MKTKLCVCSLLLSATFALAQDDTVLVHGRLLDYATGEPVTDVSNVWVQVKPVDPAPRPNFTNYLESAVSKPGGEFAVTVPYINQSWRVLAPGYWSSTVVGGQTDHVAIVRLRRPGNEPGVVLDSSGQPVFDNL